MKWLEVPHVITTIAILYRNRYIPCGYCPRNWEYSAHQTNQETKEPALVCSVQLSEGVSKQELLSPLQEKMAQTPRNIK